MRGAPGFPQPGVTGRAQEGGEDAQRWLSCDEVCFGWGVLNAVLSRLEAAQSSSLAS